MDKFLVKACLMAIFLLKSSESQEDIGQTRMELQLTKAFANSDTRLKQSLTENEVSAFMKAYKAAELDPASSIKPANSVIIVKYKHKKPHAAVELYRPSSAPTPPLSIAGGNGFWIEKISRNADVHFVIAFSLTKLGSNTFVESVEGGAMYRGDVIPGSPTYVQYFTLDARKPETTTINIFYAKPAGEMGRMVDAGLRKLFGDFRKNVLDGGREIDELDITLQDI